MENFRGEKKIYRGGSGNGGGSITGVVSQEVPGQGCGIPDHLSSSGYVPGVGEAICGAVESDFLML